jgi:hypothetical protein
MPCLIRATAAYRRLVHSYSSAAGSGVQIAFDVPPSVAQALTSLRRLPKEGAGLEASLDLALVSTTLNRLSSEQAIPAQCRAALRTGS